MEIKIGYVYHCPTREMAKTFLKDAQEQGFKWSEKRDAPYGEYIFSEYEDMTCYKIWGKNNIGFSDKLYYIKNGDKVIEYEQKYDYKIIFNPPATILFKDGKKYVAKCHPDDTFNEMIGLQVAFLKSFGIKYRDLQAMLQTAKRPKAKIEEVDVNEGKSYNSDDVYKIIVDGNDFCIGINDKTNKKFYTKEPSRDYVGTNWTNFIPKSKRGRPRKTEVKSKRPVGRPKKVKTEEPKPKRPVGRPRKQKLEIGDWVKLKNINKNDVLASPDCKLVILEIQEDGTALLSEPVLNLRGFYSISNLELIEKGDKHDK